MWQQYRKTFAITQLFIAAVLVGGYFTMGLPLGWIVMLLLGMEGGSVLGAWWGARLQRSIEKSRNRLPLER
jgi:uncharacterized membrane protein YfcA